MDLKKILYIIFGLSIAIDLFIRILNKKNITNARLSNFLKKVSKDKTKKIIGFVFLLASIIIIAFFLLSKYKIGKDNKVKDYLEYKLLDDGTYEVSNYIWNEEEKNIVIPSEYKGKKVTSIGESAFDTIKESRKHVLDYSDHFCMAETIVLPPTIKKIKKCAFLDCRKLEKIELPEDLEEIGYFAFMRCYEKEIKFNNKLVKIGFSAFTSNKYLREVNLPNSIKYIEGRAFEDCRDLKQIQINKNVESIGNCAFKDCCELEMIELPENIQKISQGMFYGCEKLKNVTVYNKTVYIKNMAFFNCKSLSNFTIPDSVEEIGDMAFADCDELSELFIPKSVKKIGKCIIEPSFTSVKCEADSKLEGWDEKCFDGVEGSGDNKVLYGQTR